MSVRPEILLIAGGAVLAAWLLTGKNAANVAQNVGAAAVDMADGVISGAVLTIGDKLGVPNTSQPRIVEQGRAELAAGDYWNASFHLPAGEFISGVWNHLTN